MASLLDLRGVWRLLRGEALRERQAADRYGTYAAAWLLPGCQLTKLDLVAQQQRSCGQEAL